MAYRLGVDLGASCTAAAVSVDGARPELFALSARAPEMPSVLYLGQDGNFLVGEVAERAGEADPNRLISGFKRRLGEDVPFAVAEESFAPEALTAALLRYVAGQAGARQGGAPTELVLTHPTSWGSYRLEVFDRAVQQAGVGPARRCAEAEAGAVMYAARNQLDPGMRIAVYDLGGGTFDVTVLERTPTGFSILGTPGEVDGLGGSAFDESVYRLVMGGLGDRIRDFDQADPDIVSRLASIKRGCVTAKETLSTQTQAGVPVDLPGFTTTVKITRSEFVSLIRPALRQTTTAVRRVLAAANTEAGELTAIVLIGGSSRIPAVSEVLQREFGVPLALGTHPKHDVALGSLLTGQLTATMAPAAQAPPAAPVAPAHPADPPATQVSPGEATTEIRTPTPAAASAPQPVRQPAAQSAPTVAFNQPRVHAAPPPPSWPPDAVAAAAPMPVAAVTLAAGPPTEISPPPPGAMRPPNPQEPRMAFPPPPPPPGSNPNGPGGPPRSWSPNSPSAQNQPGPYPGQNPGQGSPQQPPPGYPQGGPPPGYPQGGPPPGYPQGPPPGYPAAGGQGGMGGMGGRPPGGPPTPGFPSGHAPIPQGPGGGPGGTPPSGSKRTLILILAGALLLVGAIATAGVFFFRSREPDIATVPTVRPTTFAPRPTPTPTPTPTDSPTPRSSGSQSPTPEPSTSLSQDLPKSAPLPINQLIAPIERDGDRDLFLVDVTGRAKTKQLPSPNGPDNNPMMQPSRDTIIYINGSELRVMAADGTGDRALLDAPPKGCGAVEHSSWSQTEPDQLLVQCVPEKEVNELMVIRLDGTVVRRLKINQERIDDPSLSADGQTVLFWASNSFDEQGGSIYSMPIDNSEKPTRLTKSDLGVDADPAFSPDGEFIAFRRRVPNGTSEGNLDVFVMRSTGKGQRAVVKTPAADFKPVWSPDSQQLLVVSDRTSANGEAGDTFDLWLTRASNGKVVRKLGLKAPYVTTPFWVQK